MMAFALQQGHDYESAITLYEKSLAENPDNQDVRRAYADALASAGRNAAARTELQKIIRLQPEDGLSHLRLGQLDRQEGRFDEARKELDRAKVLLPESVEVPFQQAMLEDAAGNQDKAIEILQGMIEQTEKGDGKNATSDANSRAIFLERLGLIYRSQEKFDKAIETFRQAGALGGEHAARAEALVVETLRLNRQPQKALEAAGAALQKYPKDRALRTVHATLLGEQGKVDEAVQDLKSMMTNTASDREIYLTIAQVYSQAKRFEESEAAGLKALELSKGADEQEYPHFVLGSIYERQKKYDQAEKHFREVLAANPLNAAAFNYLGYMLADRGVRLDESVKFIQKALEIEPSNGAYLDSLGWAYYKMSRYDLAAPNLEKAAKMITGDPTIQEHLGYVYLEMGKFHEAQTAWEKALEDWHTAVTSEFDAEQAAKLQKKLDELKSRPTKDKSTPR
jgi:tetratricopeptide (TPR) repeat protein